MKEIRKIVIASDSFKGSLSSSQVASAISEGIRDLYPSVEIIKINVADGGEGTTEAILESVDGEAINIKVFDPLGRKIDARYGIIDDGQSAIIEVAAASGLTLLSHEERNPMVTSSYGTGEMIADALERGCRRIYVGLGGSATNDCGMGMFSALGYKFYDSYGNILEGCGASLKKVAHIDESDAIPELIKAEFIIACDVDNPFYGPRGAAYIYAGQKGADSLMIEDLDKGLEHFAGKIYEKTGCDISAVPGAGAAGGLGGAFISFLSAKTVKGIDMILNTVQFDELITDADLVITGEGKIDRQTAMGKVPLGVLNRAKKQNIKVIALAGIIEDLEEVSSLGFDNLIQITQDKLPDAKAMQPSVTKQNLITSIKSYLSAVSTVPSILPVI